MVGIRREAMNVGGRDGIVPTMIHATRANILRRMGSPKERAEVFTLFL